MRVLCIGGLGVIGRAVADEHAADPSWELVVADSRPDAGCEHVVDVRDGAAVSALMGATAPDVVVNLAALVSFPVIAADPTAAAEINLVGSLHVLEAARDHGVRRVVFGSSKAVYGNITGAHAHPTYLPVDEDTTLAPINPYDALKVAAEVTGRVFADQHGIDLVALRFGTIFGPGKTARHGYSALFSRFVEAAVAGARCHVEKGGDQGDDLMYVRDCARAIVAAARAEGDVGAPYNIASGRRTTVREYVAALREVVPGADVSIGDGLNYADEKVSYRSVLDIGRAGERLGYAPAYDLRDGIADYVEWERSRDNSSR